MDHYSSTISPKQRKIKINKVNTNHSAEKWKQSPQKNTPSKKKKIFFTSSPLSPSFLPPPSGAAAALGIEGDAPIHRGAMSDREAGDHCLVVNPRKKGRSLKNKAAKKSQNQKKQSQKVCGFSLSTHIHRSLNYFWTLILEDISTYDSHSRMCFTPLFPFKVCGGLTLPLALRHNATFLEEALEEIDPVSHEAFLCLSTDLSGVFPCCSMFFPCFFHVFFHVFFHFFSMFFPCFSMGLGSFSNQISLRSAS